ncbi:hypothetical protein J1N51_02640 [Psychrosphaera ytuae]|uniref:LPS-assembly lipoprotein LptE n=1 Tax=Psychrosphaera ytuae TaxID=2820710 RepID=A0A975DCW5_9GAMM|nr:LPS assembly lipoprotein LptE [Psychrosphaera ytuae]QTH64404.1 hypothetical protein J1N51_02640 [Psychrosphaera ytuae]
MYFKAQLSKPLKPWLMIISLLLVTGVLSGCGFHLKGQYYLPSSLKTLYVSSEQRFDPLLKQVKLRLQQNQVNIIEKRGKESAELRLLPESFQRRTLSLFPNGQIAEYELMYFARYEVIRPNGDKKQYTVELSREFQDDPNNALAKERERALILDELRVIASDRILAQLTMLD